MSNHGLLQNKFIKSTKIMDISGVMSFRLCQGLVEVAMNATAPTDSLAPVPDLLRGSTADPMPLGTIGQGVQGVVRDVMMLCSSDIQMLFHVISVCFVEICSCFSHGYLVLGWLGEKKLIDFEIEVRLDHRRLSEALSRDWPMVL